ncbi:hypothetical protein LTR62_005390 [Meristemomyces frigidus]|uniref:Zn(2)-C6 fungal-type domain-containing protein n=1 Tax=Meristemomyces frigidus TaxID=1508187 RepID=A0AAN7TDL9_9PEZI|nr:hypothetical protein LTR62_005390 [Meristemomyces frigidus]
MASDYNGGSPSSDMLNLGGGGMAPPSVFGGSQSGSDYGFGTPRSLHLDTVMHAGSANGQATMHSYRSMPGGMAGGMQGFGTAFDHTGLSQSANGAQYHRGGLGRPSEEATLPMHHDNRLSIGSNGQYAELGQNSELGSDSTSPGAHGRNSFGDSRSVNANNDTITTRAPAVEDLTGGRPDDASAPSWSELKTKAGKERKRLPLACIACRRKKIRCSGEKPACKHCLRSRIPCVYKVTTRKAAPRTDYMAMLDKRLKRMEDRVIKIIPKDEQQGMVASTGRSIVKPALPPPAPPKATSKKRGAEVAFNDELNDWAAEKQNNKAPVKADAQPGADAEAQAPHEAEERNLLLEGADKLPSKGIQEHLTEVYFDYVYGQSYHLLHKPSFIRKLAQGTIPPVLILAVCAVSARFSNHPAVRTEPAFLRGEQWAAPARDIALNRYDTPNITILISYLLLGLHEFGTCQGGRSWMLCGMAQRMAYALQLHNDLDHDPKIRRGSDGKQGEGDLTFTDREIRRRTVWSCFLMDRFTSSGSDRPIFVSEQYIKAQLPIREDYYQMEITGPTEDLAGNVPNPVEPDTGQMQDTKANMGVAAYLVRLVSIWGRVIQYLNLGGKDRDERPMWAEDSVFMGMKQSLEAWADSLPSWMSYSQENLQNYASLKIANQYLFMHILHNQVILFMNRFALPMPNRRAAFPADMPTTFIQDSSRAAFDAANQISALIHEAMDHMVVAPFAGYCAFFSSTVHINGAFSRDAKVEASSKQNLAWNVKYLTKMKKYWGMFHFVTENLRELYRRHADVARSGANVPTPSAKVDAAESAEIFQYGDWFDRYPHGVSGTDYEEPATEAVKKEPGADGVLGQSSDLQTVEDFFAKLSPPSRAAHVQQQAKQKAQKKRRASKSEKKAVAEAASAADSAALQSTSANEMQALQALQAQQNLLAAQAAGYPDSALEELRQHSIAFPPGYQQPPNPLLQSPQPQHMLSQLDRQMVLNSYAGIDHTSSSNLYHQNAQMLQQAQLDPFHLDAEYANHNLSLGNGGSNTNAGGGAGSWGDPSTAWFMPFNLDPPTIGDDNNLFGGGGGGGEEGAGFDWGSMGGFGDLGGLPTGLTPRTGLTPLPLTGNGDGGMRPGSGDPSGLEGFEGL